MTAASMTVPRTAALGMMMMMMRRRRRSFLSTVMLVVMTGMIVFLGVCSSQEVRLNPFRSPAFGALNAHMTVAMRIESPETYPSCSTVQFEPEDIIQESLSWPFSGLRKFSRSVALEAQKYATAAPQSLQAAENTFAERAAAGNLRRRILQQLERGNRRAGKSGINSPQQVFRRDAQESDSSSGGGGADDDDDNGSSTSVSQVRQKLLDEFAQCTARRESMTKGALSEGMCACLSDMKAADFCSTLEAYQLAVGCVDQAKDLVDKTAMCNSVTRNDDYGVTLSTWCSGSVAGIVEGLGLDLNKLNFPASTPSSVAPNFVAQEARTYYLALKAVERLTKWVDAHIFCTADHNNEDLLNDFVPLPTWKPVIYFWLHAPDGTSLPIGVMAQKTESASGKAIETVQSTMLLFRDIRTTYEAMIVASHEMSRLLLNDGTGMVHYGYDAVARQVVPLAAAFLEKYFATSSPSQPKILTIGHGHFGGGIAAVVAHDLAGKFSQTSGHVVVEHDLITFEAGRVGDYIFSREVAKLVNVRNVVSPNSGVRDVPCESMISCGGDDGYENITGYTTGSTTNGPYVQLPGVATWNAAMMKGKWPGADNNDEGSSSSQETVAEMKCAPFCWASQARCSDDATNYCDKDVCKAFL